MSYILDSLKKSDKERQEANLDDGVMLSGRGDGDSGENTVPLYVLFIVFLLLLAGGFYIGWRSSADFNDAPMHALPERNLASESSEITVSVKPDQPIESGDDSKKPVAAVTQPADVPAETLPNTKEQQLYEQRRRQQQSSSDVSALYEQYVRKIVSQPVEVEPETEVNEETVDADNPLPDEDVASSFPVDGIPSLFQLDPLVRAGIPAIDYGAHIYASDNQSGFVILNGGKRQSGDQLPNGVYIESVRENDVILSYKGQVFLLPAMKSWQP